MTLQIDTIVAVPTLNEVNHIDAVIRDLRADSGECARSLLWIIDGGSTDGTQGIVLRYARSDPGIRLIHNPLRRQASAINLAAKDARQFPGVQYLIRADAHCRYPEKWISRLIATAEEEGVDSVVVPMRTCGRNAMSVAAADLFNSWLGTGGSPHRIGDKRGLVEHGHHALFRLDAILDAGGYDPVFVANEDAELDIRLRQMGRRIFLENLATVDYFAREKLSGVARQFFRNGRYRIRTSRKHSTPLSSRQLAPIVLVASLIVCGLAGLFVKPLFFAPIAIYLVAVLMAATMIAAKKSLSRIGLIFLQAVVSHVAFGLGALRSLLSTLVDRPATSDPSIIVNSLGR